MGARELQAKYDAPNSRAAINRAIRAELPGGGELLDALEIAHKAAGRRESSAAGRILVALSAVKIAMESEIRRRYDMPTS
jgi:hypothetical protein